MKSLNTIAAILLIGPLIGLLTASPGLAEQQADEKTKAKGEQKKKPDQIWYGVLDVKVAKLRLAFELDKREGGGYSGRMFSLDQGGKPIDLDRVEFGDGQLVLSCKQVGAKFQGKLNEKQTIAEGEFEQGAKFPLVLRHVEKMPELKLVEVWRGDLKAGARTLDLRVRVFKGPDGKLSAKFDSLTENVNGLTATVKRDDKQLAVEVPLVKASFKGELNDAATEVKGVWSQGGAELPLTFKKVTAKDAGEKKPKRPQTPKAPFPYEEENVRFKKQRDNVTLAATLTIPKGDQPHPAAILISGSGPQDRDESIAGHKPFWVLADHLSRKGIAVLRFDDRGVGDSTGDHNAATSESFARDVLAGVEFLKLHKRIDKRRIGLVGHSEGGLIAPLAAVASRDVALIVLLAGPGVTGEEILYSQGKLIAEASGLGPEAVAESHRMQKVAIRHAKQSPPDVDLEKLTKQIVDEYLKDVPEAQREQKRPNALALAGLRVLTTPWFRYFLVHDPRDVLKRVRCPVLALNGEKDLQVEPKLNLGEIEQALKAGGNKDFEVREFKSLNHLFQTAESGLPGNYGRIEETIAPAMLEALTKWLKDHGF